MNCIDCNKKIYKYSTRCKSCSRKGANNPNFGKVSALRGKKITEIQTPENAKKHAERLKNGLFKGNRHTENTKLNHRIKNTGSGNGFYNKKHSDETVGIIRQKTINQFKDGRTCKSDTSIEMLFEKYLIELQLKYEKQKQFGFFVFDFYLTDFDIYIECDGDYWHVNPKYFGEPLGKAQIKNLLNDRRKNTFTYNRGKLLLRFWEDDILNNKTQVINQLKLQLSKSA